MCVHHSVHLSMQLRSGGWNPRPRGKPLVVGLEWQPKLFVVDTQVAVVTADDSIRPHGLNFLRHYADITLVAAVVAEAIEARPLSRCTNKMTWCLNAMQGRRPLPPPPPRPPPPPPRPPPPPPARAPPPPRRPPPAPAMLA